jgi:hypothetical protein
VEPQRVFAVEASLRQSLATTELGLDARVDGRLQFLTQMIDFFSPCLIGRLVLTLLQVALRFEHGQ